MSKGKKLSDQDAFNLYQKGEKAWNNWVKQNPDGEIDFSNFDFGIRNLGGEAISFKDFVFPNGGVCFNCTKFGNGSVGFNGADFGNGDVGFNGAQFGGRGVRFDGAKFRNGDVSFFCAHFGDGDVSFQDARFGDGGVNFFCAKFGNGGVIFYRARFGDGAVSFNKAQFGDDAVRFDGAHFGDGGVSFHGAHFGDGDISFRDAHFGDGDVGFHGAHFGNGDIDFGKTQFDGSLYFEAIQNTEKMSSLSFNGAVFKQNFVIEGRFHCIPDLRHTKIEHHLDLSNVKIDEDLEIDKLIKDEPEAKAACLRRLRELTENNRHHDAGLDFFALESRVMRKSGHWGRLRSALDCLYEWASNYGRSILRPLFWWLFFMLLFFVIYWLVGQDAKWQDALNLALSNALPFILSSRGQAEDVFQVLFPGKTVWPVVLTYLQSFLSLVFIFLIGLGLRNRFRL